MVFERSSDVLVDQKVGGVGEGERSPRAAAVGTISLKHLYHIAESKQGDMPGLSLRGVVKCLMHQCRSMGVKVVARPEDG